MRILPKYITVIMEDCPLLRVVEQGGAVKDFELRHEQLGMLAQLALNLYLRNKERI